MQNQRKEWRPLIWLGAGIVVLLVVATLVPMFVVLFDRDREAEDVLPLMAGPIGVLLVGAVVAGIAAAVQSANRNARAAERSSEQGLRVGIVWILGLALLALVVVFGVLAGDGDTNLPDGLVALASSLAGGLIGILAPRSAPRPGEGGGGGGDTGVNPAPPPPELPPT